MCRGSAARLQQRLMQQLLFGRIGPQQWKRGPQPPCAEYWLERSGFGLARELADFLVEEIDAFAIQTNDRNLVENVLE